jgi:hypothetical protein
MKIVFNQAQISEKKLLKRKAKKERALCRDADRWYTDLMSLPIDARIAKVAHGIAREAIYSLTEGDIKLSVSLARVAGLASLQRECVVIIAQNGQALDVQTFSSSTRAATYFLTQLAVYRPTDAPMPETQGHPVSQYSQKASSGNF